MILTGDCLEVMRRMKPNCVDAIVTDPPYGLKFMGKKWDYDVPSIEIWREALRVLKPGGHLLSFGGTRTYHRMVVNIEDAGFEIRDQLQWIYSQGFPKSLDISKAIDKAAGAERAIVGENPNHRGESQMRNPFTKSLGQNGSLTVPATEDAKRWQGWGTALKPANEPIVLARKPLIGTVAANVLKHGTGGLNIDATRIASGEDLKPVFSGAKGKKQAEYGGGTVFGNSDKYESNVSPLGRWPANVIFDEDAAAVLDEQTKDLHGAGKARSSSDGTHAGGDSLFGKIGGPAMRFGDSGGASRFFYCAKSSTSEKNAGLEGATNTHPTVKPLKLMEYLITLITPPGGTVLDPFTGSGTTGVAATKLGFKFLGIEMSQEYVDIAKKRINACKSGTQSHSRKA